MTRVQSPSAEATRRLGRHLGTRVRPGEVLALAGDLGAGKTVLVQGLAEGLAVPGPVTSPTFVLMAEYAGRLPLYHVDLYRVETLKEARALGLPDLIGQEWRGGVTAIEWGDRVEPLLPAGAIWIRIRGAGDEPREIEIAGAPPEWEVLAG